MTKRLALLLLFSICLVFALVVRPSKAVANDRLLGEAEFIKKLNGSSRTLGKIYLDAGSVNNCNTGAGIAFDAGKGDIIVTVCNVDVFMAPGNCATVATINDEPVKADDPRLTTLAQDEMAISFKPFDGGTAGGCYYGHKR